MRNLQELPKLRDSLSYLYLEHGRLEQAQKSVAFVDKKGGYTPIPAASLSVLLMGPGTTITHAAVKALADNGCLVIWSGQDGTKMYAQGIGETRKAYRLLKQADLASDEQKRLAALENVVASAADNGFSCLRRMVSPIAGQKGNQEFLVYLRRD